jgi:hypothetical protein
VNLIFGGEALVIFVGRTGFKMVVMCDVEERKRREGGGEFGDKVGGKLVENHWDSWGSRDAAWLGRS